LTTGLIERAVQSAACLERARCETILRAGPPETTAWLLSVTFTLAFAIGLGMAIGTPRQLVAARVIRQRRLSFGGMLAQKFLPLVTAALALLGCSFFPISGNLPAHKDLSGYPAALLTAELVVEGECLFADSTESAGRWLPIWPKGFALQDGVLTDPNGRVAAIGDTVKLGGGEYHDSDFDFVQTMLVVPVPASCRGGDYWLVSEVVE
jgi:hypothetical protein